MLSLFCDAIATRFLSVGTVTAVKVGENAGILPEFAFKGAAVIPACATPKIEQHLKALPSLPRKTKQQLFANCAESGMDEQRSGSC